MRAFPVFLIACAACAADWPQLRGPDASGLCADCGPLPAEFGPEKNVVWKTPLPEGKSSPVLARGRIFLTAAERGELLTFCLDKVNGRILWRRSIPAPRRDFQHKLNHPAAPTPAVGEEGVYVFFPSYGLLAYGFDGELQWRRPLGPYNSQHGISASPVYADGRVILLLDQDTDAHMIAFDARTGKTAWKAPREVINGYSTPTVYRPPDGPAQILAPGSYQLTAYSVRDGEQLWFVRGLTCQPKSAPVIADGVVYFNGWTAGNDDGQQVDLPPFAEVIKAADANGDGKLAQSELPPPWQPTGTWRAIDLDRDGFLNEREWTFFRTRRASRNAILAVKLGGSGDVTSSHVLWRYSKSLPDVPSPLVYNGTVFLFRSGGIATSLDARTGRVIKQARLTGALDDYYSSPVGAGGRVYAASEHGKVVVLSAKGEWEILAVNDFGAPIFATPALEPSRMYLRTAEALYAIGEASGR